jgi:hypothetical protein
MFDMNVDKDFASKGTTSSWRNSQLRGIRLLIGLSLEVDEIFGEIELMDTFWMEVEDGDWRGGGAGRRSHALIENERDDRVGRRDFRDLVDEHRPGGDPGVRTTTLHLRGLTSRGNPFDVAGIVVRWLCGWAETRAFGVARLEKQEIVVGRRSLTKVEMEGEDRSPKRVGKEDGTVLSLPGGVAEAGQKGQVVDRLRWMQSDPNDHLRDFAQLDRLHPCPKSLGDQKSLDGSGRCGQEL